MWCFRFYSALEIFKNFLFAFLMIHNSTVFYSIPICLLIFVIFLLLISSFVLLWTHLPELLTFFFFYKGEYSWFLILFSFSRRKFNVFEKTWHSYKFHMDLLISLLLRDVKYNCGTIHNYIVPGTIQGSECRLYDSLKGNVLVRVNILISGSTLFL